MEFGVEMNKLNDELTSINGSEDTFSTVFDNPEEDESNLLIIEEDPAMNNNSDMILVDH